MNFVLGKNRKRILISFLATVEKNSMDVLVVHSPWDSSLLTSQRKCWKFSQVQSGNTEQLVSQHPFSCPDFNFPAHDLERKVQVPKTLHIWHRRQEILHPCVDNAAKNKAHVPKVIVLLPTKEAFS